MAKRRTWLWIVGGVCLAGVFTIIAIAAAGIYFVSSHVQTEPTTGAQAIDAFDAVAASFEGRRPLYELDAHDRPHLKTELASLPTAATRPGALMVQAWDPNQQKLVRVAVPFWLLRLGRNNMRVSNDDGFDFNRLDLNVDELERIGPTLVLDYRNQDGVRVLLWTK